MPPFRRTSIYFFAITICLVVSGTFLQAAEFNSTFRTDVTRHWAGPEYWTNPMEDWQISDGRLEVLRSGGNRNVHVLTHQLGRKSGTFETSATIGRLETQQPPASVGFRVGIQSELGDYKSALLFGRGLNAGISADGKLFIGNEADADESNSIGKAKIVNLKLSAKPAGNGYSVTLTATDEKSGDQLAEVEKTVPAAMLVGNIALVNNFSQPRRRHPQQPVKRIAARHWFTSWSISGSKVVEHADQTFGPILWSMHTLSRQVMKMTALVPPVGKSDSQSVELQTKQNGQWKSLGSEKIHPLARTATFKIENWDDSADTPYRLVYLLKDAAGKPQPHYWTGTVRKNPTDRELVVAGFTGNTDTGFPNTAVATNVAAMNPDVLLFTGDQIYEQVGGYGIHRGPVDVATVNYLRKFYLFGMAFGDIMRDRPTLCLPDDHDVYQGNIWGNGGNATNMAQHDAGGYAMPAEWVNMIQRTQTSHHPKPYDATPIKQDITVYYGDMLYGRVSFAILEDRKFKSGPKGTVAYWKGRSDHVKDPKFDPKSIDKPGLTLLGNRQLKFLRDWSADWRGADMKVVCSQTIFCNLANYHGGNKEYLIADLDSNGWPQTGRNKALSEIRKGFGFMYAGDQHLPSIIHHGIDAQGDAGYSFCVPSIAAGYPRSWLPDKEGRPVQNRPEGGLPNTGDYREGLGNRARVYAIGNPAAKNRPGVLNTLHDKSSGFGIVRFDKPTRNITMECWKLLFDVNNTKPTDQFPGWPKTIKQSDNYGRKAAAYLPEIQVTGMKDPVVQVIDEDNEIVYTLRIKGTNFRPKVFDKNGTYTVKVGDQDSGNMKTFKGLKPSNDKLIKARF